MAVAQIRVSGSSFIVPDEQNPGQIIEKTLHKVLGWTCSIQKSGTVICRAAQKGFDGWHVKRLIIKPNGQVRISLKVGTEKENILKKYYLTRKGENIKHLDVIIGLSDGWIDSRKVYVRNEEFQEILDKKGITAIRACNPNKIYTMKSITYQDGRYLYQGIKTDGILQVLGVTEKSNDLFEETIATIQVINATWTIKTEEHNTKYNVDRETAVLFTKKNVNQISSFF